jgi:hypothetical protein
MAGRQIDPGPDGDSFLTKIGKLIPSEVTAAFLFINNLVNPDLPWTAPGILLPTLALAILCPLLLWKIQNVQSALQVAITTGLFFIWVLNIAPLRFDVGTTTPAILLALATVALPLVIKTPREPE